MKRLLALPRGQRLLVFSFIALGTLALLIGVTLLLALLTVNNVPRSVAQPIAEGVQVTEYAVIPGDDAYPAPLVVAPDGTVYTASYSSGEVYVVAPGATEATVIPGSADSFASVAGLVYDEADGSLIVLDRVTGNAASSGGVLYRLRPSDGSAVLMGRLDEAAETVALNGLARDAEGYLYAADLLGAVWRFNPDGTGGGKWWEAPRISGSDVPVVTDVAFDPASGFLYATDSRLNAVYRIDIAAAASTDFYRFNGEVNPPGLAGITVSADGLVYVTAIDEKALMVVRDGQLEYLAGFFRGPWDAAVLPDGRIVVSNIDSRALATPGLSPQLPFALDVVTLP